jgi:mono/diheme cytochrome c family protein
VRSWRGRTSHPGEQIYHRYCIGCHGADGRGNGGITGADFTAADGPLTQRDQATLIASVRDGKRGERATMPAHAPVLTEAQIEAVVAYVRTRFAPAGAGQPPEGAEAASATAPSPAAGDAPQAPAAPASGN